ENIEMQELQHIEMQELEHIQMQELEQMEMQELEDIDLPAPEQDDEGGEIGPVRKIVQATVHQYRKQGQAAKQE
ncbi:hypothetical protein OS493_019618, partial [Desmophyllum pertusum]